MKQGNGYIKNKMSVNALCAYDHGEKPYSKWTKSDIIEEAAKILESCDNHDLSIDDLKKASVKVLKERYLICSSYHHTGKLYNKTDFYTIDAGRIEEDTKEALLKYIQKTKEEEKEKREEAKKYEYATMTYIVWEGAYKRYKKPVEYQAQVIVMGGYAYALDGHFADYTQKKKISGNNIKKIEYHGSRKPRSFDKAKAAKLKKDLKIK